MPSCPKVYCGVYGLSTVSDSNDGGVVDEIGGVFFIGSPVDYFDVFYVQLGKRHSTRNVRQQKRYFLCFSTIVFVSSERVRVTKVGSKLNYEASRGSVVYFGDTAHEIHHVHKKRGDKLG